MTVQGLGYDCLETVSSECRVLCHTVDIDLDTISSFDVFFANSEIVCEGVFFLTALRTMELLMRSQYQLILCITEKGDCKQLR